MSTQKAMQKLINENRDLMLRNKKLSDINRTLRDEVNALKASVKSECFVKKTVERPSGYFIDKLVTVDGLDGWYLVKNMEKISCEFGMNKTTLMLVKANTFGNEYDSDCVFQCQEKDIIKAWDEYEAKKVLQESIEECSQFSGSGDNKSMVFRDIDYKNGKFIVKFVSKITPCYVREENA